MVERNGLKLQLEVETEKPADVKAEWEPVDNEMRKKKNQTGLKWQTNVNKAGYTATQVTCWLAGAVIKKANHAFGQEQ